MNLTSSAEISSLLDLRIVYSQKSLKAKSSLKYFTHGHTYVYATRVRHFNDLAYMVDSNSLPFEPDEPDINKVEYPHLLI